MIAYRPTDDAEFIYPLEQFNKTDGVESWAGRIVHAVGNGSPALHFLYTKRASLDFRSFAELLRLGGDEGEHALTILETAIARLAHDTAK